MRFFILWLMLCVAAASAAEVSYDFGGGRIEKAVVTVTPATGGWNFNLVSVTKASPPVGAGLSYGFGHRLGVTALGAVGTPVFVSNAQIASLSPFTVIGIYYFGATTASSVVPISFGPQSQTVTLTPSSASILSGQYAQFTANGGQNDYQWLITGGGVTKNGNTFIVRGTAKGSFSLTVWSPEGNGYARSNNATAVFSVTESFSKQVNLQKNEGSRPVQYLVLQNGEVVAEYIQQPGQGARIVTVIVETNDPLTVVSRVVGITQNENDVWVVDPSQNSPDTTSDPITPDSSENPTPGPVIDAPKPNAPNPGTPNNDNAPVWNNTPANNNPTSQTDLLTNSVFREGVNHMADIQNQIKEIFEKEVEEKEARKKALDEYMGQADSKVKTKADEYFNFVTGATKTEFDTKWGTDVGEFGTIQTANINAPTGGTGWPKVTIPILGTIEFSPTRIPWLIPIMNVCREIVLWLLVYGFCRFGIEKAMDYSMQVATVPNVTTTQDLVADAIPVIAEKIQYIKQGITALGLVITLVVTFGVVVGFINTGIFAAMGSGTVGSLLTGGASYINSSLAGAASPLWGFIFEFFPMGAFITLLVGEVLLIALMAPVFILASVLVRTLRA